MIGLAYHQGGYTPTREKKQNSHQINTTTAVVILEQSRRRPVRRQAGRGEKALTWYPCDRLRETINSPDTADGGSMMYRCWCRSIGIYFVETFKVDDVLRGSTARVFACERTRPAEGGGIPTTFHGLETPSSFERLKQVSLQTKNSSYKFYGRSRIPLTPLFSHAVC